MTFHTRFAHYPDEKLLAILRDDPSKYDPEALAAATAILQERGYDAQEEAAAATPLSQESKATQKYQRIVYAVFIILLFLFALLRLILYVEAGQTWHMLAFLLLLIAGIIYLVHHHLRPIL